MQGQCRQVIDWITMFLAWMKRRQTIKLETAIVKVNLGCGLAVADGWINVDASLNALIATWPSAFLRLLYPLAGAKEFYTQGQYVDVLKNHRFFFHNLEYGLPFYDESVDYIYTSHFLEHIFQDQAERLIQESFRVLKRGGIMRICVPDLEYAVSLYLEGQKRKALGFFFRDSKTGYFEHHKYMYDFDLLKDLVVNSRFTTIERCAYQEGKTPDLDQLDNRPEQTLFAEAVK